MPRTKVATITVLVVFERDGEGWHVFAPDVQGCRSHGRSIAEARRNIREALGACVDVYGEDAVAVADAAEFDEDIRLPRDAKTALQRAWKARMLATAAAREGEHTAAESAKALREAGLSLRDVGDLLGLSHQRIKQIAG